MLRPQLAKAWIANRAIEPGFRARRRSADRAWFEYLGFRQAARNEALTSLLARCPIADDTLAAHRQHIMDKRGEGVSIVLETSERLSGKRPEYPLIDHSELKLTNFAAALRSKKNDFGTSARGRRRSDGGKNHTVLVVYHLAEGELPPLQPRPSSCLDLARPVRLQRPNMRNRRRRIG